jgi:hypothetical protein
MNKITLFNKALLAVLPTVVEAWLADHAPSKDFDERVEQSKTVLDFAEKIAYRAVERSEIAKEKFDEEAQGANHIGDN